MKRLRFIIGSLDVGGTETHLSRILPALQGHGYQCRVLTLTHKGVLAEQFERAGISVIAPPAVVRALQRVPILSRVLGPLATILYLARNYRIHPADITCFYLPSSYYLGMLAVFLSGDRSRRLMFRRSLNVYQQGRPLIAWLERRLHRYQSAIVANSEAVRRQLVEEEQVAPEQTRLIYNGIEFPEPVAADVRRRFRESFGADEQTTIMCLVANLIPYKGHRDLIDALAIAAGRLSRPWQLWCVGRGIETRPDLIEQVEAHGLGDRIHWLGQRQDVADVLACSDIGLLVSHQEGFSNAIIEAMASGLPMVVTGVGGNAEAVLHEQTGLVVPPANPAALAEAIIRLVNEPDLAASWGKAGRERVQQMFAMTACLDGYRKLLEEM